MTKTTKNNEKKTQRDALLGEILPPESSSLSKLEVSRVLDVAEPFIPAVQEAFALYQKTAQLKLEVARDIETIHANAELEKLRIETQSENFREALRLCVEHGLTEQLDVLVQKLVS